MKRLTIHPKGARALCAGIVLSALSDARRLKKRGWLDDDYMPTDKARAGLRFGGRSDVDHWGSTSRQATDLSALVHSESWSSLLELAGINIDGMEALRMSEKHLTRGHGLAVNRL